MSIFDIPNPSSTTVWDQVVPIVTEKHHTEVYLNDQIDIPSTYNELCYRLKNASSAETFTINVNTPGGIIDSAFMIIDAIKLSKATVTASLTGTVASAGTVISLACDNLVVADHTAFMIHNYSGGMQGKGHEMKAHQAFVDANLNESFKKMYAGFLSEQEMEDVIEGKDLWFNKEEILERWAVKTGSKAKPVKKKD